jgi:RNA polymerase sigma factor (sigma-70 family)
MCMDKKRQGDRTGPEARLETLFRRHYVDVARYVRRRAEPDFVEDVVAETFLVAWRRLDDIPAEARPWLLGVARRTLATQRRSATRRRSLVAKLDETARRPVHAEDSLTDAGISEALAHLSEKDREAITLVAWDGLNAREAAVVLGQSPVSFRVRLHRAKRRLRQRLEAVTPSQPSALVATEIVLTRGGLKK